MSKKEIDWVLISPDSSYSAAHREVLPGLSTHLALLVDIQLSMAALRPVDPCGRRFLFSRAQPAALQHAATIFALAAWWAAAAGASVDHIIRYGHAHRV